MANRKIRFGPTSLLSGTAAIAAEVGGGLLRSGPVSRESWGAPNAGTQSLEIVFDRPRSNVQVAPETVFLRANPTGFTLAPLTNPAEEREYTDIEYFWTVQEYVGETFTAPVYIDDHFRSKAHYAGRQIPLVLERAGTWNIACTAVNKADWTEVASATFEIVTADPDVYFRTSGRKTYVVAADGNYSGAPANDGTYTTINAAISASETAGVQARIMVKENEYHAISDAQWASMINIQNLYIDTWTGTLGSGRARLQSIKFYEEYGGNRTLPATATSFLYKNIEVTGTVDVTDPTLSGGGGSPVGMYGGDTRYTAAYVDCLFGNNAISLRTHVVAGYSYSHIDFVFWNSTLFDDYLCNGLMSGNRGISGYIGSRFTTDPEAPISYPNDTGYINGWGVRDSGQPPEEGYVYAAKNDCFAFRNWTNGAATQACWRFAGSWYAGQKVFVYQNKIEGMITFDPTGKGCQTQVYNIVVDSNRFILSGYKAGVAINGFNGGAVIQNNLIVGPPSYHDDGSETRAAAMATGIFQRRDEVTPPTPDTEAEVRASRVVVMGNTFVTYGDKDRVGDILANGGGNTNLRLSANLVHAPYQSVYAPAIDGGPINTGRAPTPYDGQRLKRWNLVIPDQWQAACPSVLIQVLSAGTFTIGEVLTSPSGATARIYQQQSGQLWTGPVSGGTVQVGQTLTGATSGATATVVSTEYGGAVIDGTPLSGNPAINGAEWSSAEMQPRKDFYGNDRLWGAGTTGAVEYQA